MEKQAGLIGKGLGFVGKKMMLPAAKSVGKTIAKQPFGAAGTAIMVGAPIAALSPGQATQQLAGSLV